MIDAPFNFFILQLLIISLVRVFASLKKFGQGLLALYLLHFIQDFQCHYVCVSICYRPKVSDQIDTV